MNTNALKRKANIELNNTSGIVLMKTQRLCSSENKGWPKPFHARQTIQKAVKKIPKFNRFDR